MAKIVPSVDKKIVETIFSMLLLKIYNARCNEYLKSVTSDSTKRGNKTADVHVGLRDKLKIYAAEKQVPT